MADSDKAGRPNLAQGMAVSALQPGGMLLGRVGDEDVLLTRTDDELFAVGAHCTHYHGALIDGLVVGDTVRCPLHRHGRLRGRQRGSPDSSRCSQARAKAQSDFTVAGERSIAAAVSSMLRPAK